VPFSQLFDEHFARCCVYHPLYHLRVSSIAQLSKQRDFGLENGPVSLCFEIMNDGTVILHHCQNKTLQYRIMLDPIGYCVSHFATRHHHPPSSNTFIGRFYGPGNCRRQAIAKGRYNDIISRTARTRSFKCIDKRRPSVRDQPSHFSCLATMARVEDEGCACVARAERRCCLSFGCLVPLRCVVVGSVDDGEDGALWGSWEGKFLFFWGGGMWVPAWTPRSGT
jgi:hypothetical protein